MSYFQAPEILSNRWKCFLEVSFVCRKIELREMVNSETFLVLGTSDVPY